MKRARRVARPMTSGRTPLAIGSRVPVWPTRRSRRTRRTLATMSWEVGPGGLSTMSRPSIDRLLNLLEEHLLELIDRPGHRAAGGVLVPASAELLGDCANVDLALRPHADAVVVAFGLLEEDDRLDLLDRQRKVDETFGVLIRAA